MKKILSFLFTIALMSYIAQAFILMEPNPALWSESQRAALLKNFVFSCLIVLAGTALIEYFKNNEQ